MDPKTKPCDLHDPVPPPLTGGPQISPTTPSRSSGTTPPTELDRAPYQDFL